MTGLVGELAKGSIRGIPPAVAYKLSQQGYDPTSFLDNRALLEYQLLEESPQYNQNSQSSGELEETKNNGCLFILLRIPGIRHLRKALPDRIKAPIKARLKAWLGIENLIEP